MKIIIEIVVYYLKSYLMSIFQHMIQNQLEEKK